MTKERTKIEIQTVLLHLTSDEDRAVLIRVFNAAADWFADHGQHEMMIKAADLREYVTNEVSEPVGTVLPTESK